MPVLIKLLGASSFLGFSTMFITLSPSNSTTPNALGSSTSVSTINVSGFDSS